MIADALKGAEAAAHLRPYVFESAALTHPGCIRSLNEDACLDRPDIGLWAVADGMGGHSIGEVASATVVGALNAVTDFASPFVFRKAVRSALLAANAQLHDKAATELLGTVGSTVVTLLVHHGHYACMWAGDSRAYLIRRGNLEPLTRDHSLVQELVDRGEIDAASARTHRHANIVTRAVGAGSRLELDACFGHLEPGDCFVLCSDGLGVLSDKEIAGLVDRRLASESAEALLALALDRGARDNVSCIVVCCATG